MSYFRRELSTDGRFGGQDLNRLLAYFHRHQRLISYDLDDEQEPAGLHNSLKPHLCTSILVIKRLFTTLSGTVMNGVSIFFKFWIKCGRCFILIICITWRQGNPPSRYRYQLQIRMSTTSPSFNGTLAPWFRRRFIQYIQCTSRTELSFLY